MKVPLNLFQVEVKNFFHSVKYRMSIHDTKSKRNVSYQNAPSGTCSLYVIMPYSKDESCHLTSDTEHETCNLL